MREFFLSLCRGALGIIGALSCLSCNFTIFAPEEYGSPYADFEIKGRVTDASGTPIKGIAVTVERTYLEDSTFTADDGTYVIRGEMFPQKALPVVFDDVDGEQNGGKFTKKTLDVTLTLVKDGDGKWNSGSYGAENADITLELEDAE